MRRLNKRKNHGMNALISKEKYEAIHNDLLKSVNRTNEKNVPSLPEIKINKTVEQITGISRTATPSMASFEKEYKEFIENLKKKKAENESVDESTKEVVEVKNAIETIAEETVETPAVEYKPKKKRRKKDETAE